MKNHTALKLLASLGAASISSGCASLGPSEVALPAGAIAITAPPVYQLWFERTEACSGLSGNLAAVQFYVVPGVETFPTADGVKVGEWISSGETHRIILAGNYQGHEMVVRHELLHTLLRQSGHPGEYFVDRCRLTWESWNSDHGNVGSVGDH